MTRVILSGVGSGRNQRWSSGLMEDGTVLVITTTWVTAMLIFVGLECWAFIRDRRRKKRD